MSSACTAGRSPDARLSTRSSAVDLPASAASLTLLGTAAVARTATGVLQAFGGISGLERDAGTGAWYLLSDDKSEVAPARFYTGTIDVGVNGFTDIRIDRVVTLRRADGSVYPGPREGGEVPDGEAMRLDPRDGTLVWSSEGDRRLGLDPWVRRAGLDGRMLGEWRVPSNLAVHRDVESGSRRNLSLEGLAFSPDGDSLWMAMEAPLYEDGPVPTLDHGAMARFSRVARDGALVAQYAYPVDPVPLPGVAGHRLSDNGVSEILAIGDGSLLVVERAGHEVGDLLFDFSIRLYVARIDDATDIAAVPSLVGASYRPMTKRLLCDLNRAVPGRVDNIEAASWGPRLPDGRATLVLASDDNFASNQVNQFIAFAVEAR